jgi:hypothetical protein
MKTDRGMEIGRRAGRWILLIIFIMGGLILWKTPLYATTVSLSTGAYQALGTEFRVDMVLDSVSNLYGTAVDLIYDPEYLEAVDSDGNPANGVQPKVTEGTLLSNNGVDVTLLDSALQDEIPGTLVLGLSRSGAVAGINAATTRTVLSVYFTSKKNGTTSISFSSQGLRNPSNGAIAVAAWNGVTITITDLLPVLTVDCPSVEFNLVNVGTTGNKTCTATNTGTAGLAITSISLTGGDLAVFGQSHDCPPTLSPSSSCSINLTFTPPAPGPKLTTLRIMSDILGTPTPKDLSVNGTGVTTLNVAINPPATGTVTGTGINCPGDCVETYTASGSSVQLTASPITGYHLVNWTGDAGGTLPLVTLTMDTNRSATANFAINTYTVTVSAGSNGTVDPGTITVNHGTSQTFNISANTGYHIDQVLVDGVLQTPAPSSVTLNNITATHTISVTFAINTYAITVSAGPNGSISPPGPVTVNHGASQLFNIAPITGYHIAEVRIDGVLQTPVPTSYTFANVTAPHTISALFSINTYTITVTAGAHGTVDPPGPVTLNYGQNQTFTFNPETGYHVGSVLVDGSPITPTPATSYTFTSLSANHTLSVTFVPNKFTLTVQKIGDGSGTVRSVPPGTINCGSGGADCTEDYDPATQVTLSASFDPGSLFFGWSGGVCSGAGPCTFTMDANKSVTAEFRLAPKMEISSLLLNENFSSGIPATWIVGGNWSRGSAGSPCSSSPTIGAPFAAPWAILNTACGISTFYHALYTPVFDASDCTDLKLRYNNQYKYDPILEGEPGAWNGISSDGGWSWTDVYEMNADDGYPTPNTKTDPEVDVSDLAGEAEAEIRFDILAGEGYWGIDNVQALCTLGAAVSFKAPVSGTSAPKTFLITNTGAADLVVSGSISLSGANAADFSVPSSSDKCSGKTVPPSGSCTFDVLFSPASAGPKTAALTVPSNDPDHPTTTLNLSGNAVAFMVDAPEGTYGTEIRIEGSGFGASKGTVTLVSATGSMSPVKPKILEWGLDGTYIRCLVSKAMIPGAYHVTVQPKVPKGTPPMTVQNAFTVKPPQVLWLGPYWGSVGDQVTIKGRFFTYKKGKVYIGPKAGKVISWTMDADGVSTIVLTVPKGLVSGNYYDVTVIYKTLSDTSPIRFYYE